MFSAKPSKQKQPLVIEAQAENEPRMCGLIITIDGPAGTGKSTVAHRLARKLGLEFLDTGAMYRAAALLSIERGIEAHEGRALAEALREADLHFDWTVDPPRLMLAGRDVASRVRDRAVGERVSTVAGQSEVRSVLVAQQRQIARLHPRLVTEGRDQGSVVFPDAPVRFYLDARPEVRAARRSDQLASIGKPIDRATVLQEILSRDRLDSSRADAPLIRPTGAMVIDTSDLSLDEVVERLEREARALLASAGLAEGLRPSCGEKTA